MSFEHQSTHLASTSALISFEQVPFWKIFGALFNRWNVSCSEGALNQSDTFTFQADTWLVFLFNFFFRKKKRLSS